MPNRDPTLTARNLLNVLVEVTEWEQLGTNLDMKRHKLREIEKNKRGNIGDCRLALIDLWLRTDINASWGKLVEALSKIDECGGVVERIQTEFLQGRPAGGGIQASYGGHVAGGGGAQGGFPMATGAGTVPASSGRVVPDGANNLVLSGIRQPVRVEERPEDEIRHAQLLIDQADETQPEARVANIVNKLSNWNFDIDFHNPKDSDNTLLHYSCMKGDLSMVRALVAFGADVNQLNKHHQTPLDLAKFMHKDDIVKFLREVGAGGKHLFNFVNSPVQEEGHGMEGEDAMRPDDAVLFGGHLILSLDYSSTMALVQLEVLNQLEKATGKNIWNMFEWIVASGVAGFLVMAMVYANKSISELRRIYFRLHERVFSGQAPEERGKALEEFAVEVFGPARRMVDDADQTGPKILIGAVDKKSTSFNPIFFNNYDTKYSTMHVWKVARYTCSSPLYVGECDNYIDGGAVYKNPSIFAFSTIREFYRLQSVQLSGVLSIGEGVMPGMVLGKLDRSNFYSHFYSSSANTLSEEVSRAFAAICEAGGIHYQRINPLLDEYLTIPEEAKLEQLVNAVIRTIVQCQGEDSEVQSFSRRYNNLAVQQAQ